MGFTERGKNGSWLWSRGHTILTSRELMWCYPCSGDV